MKNKVFFRNETLITDNIYKYMIFYSKLFAYRYTTMLKLSLCIFVIIGSTILSNMNLLYKIFCILVSILGILDTFEIKDEKPEFITKLKFEFFDNYLSIDNSKSLVEVSYDCVKIIINTKKNYYVVVDDLLLILSKDGFVIGNKDNLKEFINKAKLKIHN